MTELYQISIIQPGGMMACQFYTLHISISHVRGNEGRGIIVTMVGQLNFLYALQSPVQFVVGCRHK